MRVGFSFRDLLAEALDGAGAKPGRLAVGLLGTVAGIATLVLTLGLGQTAAGQVAARFDSVAATHVEVTPTTVAGSDGTDRAAAAMPDDAATRVSALAGVGAAALLTEVPLGSETISAVAVHDPSRPPISPPPLLASDGDLLGAVDGIMRSGRYFDAGHELRSDRVVVLGADAAETLGIRDLSSRPSIFIGARSYTVIGILDAVGMHRSLLSAAVIPLSTARRELHPSSSGSLLIRIAVGAGELVGRQAPIALDPAHPEGFTAAAPAGESVLSGGVSHDLDLVFLLVGSVALLAGALGIATVATLSIAERRGEIGLRRALGATRPQIAAQFLLESLLVGLLGGLIGAAVGVFAVVAVSWAQGWTPVLDTLLATGGAGIGGGVGLLAGLQPALRAARLEPADALRTAPQ